MRLQFTNSAFHFPYFHSVSCKLHLEQICWFKYLLLECPPPPWFTGGLQMIRQLCSSLLRINHFTVILVNIAVIPLRIPDKVINGPLWTLIDKHRGFGTLGSAAVFEGVPLQVCNSDLGFVILSGSCREMWRLSRNCWTRGLTLTWKIMLGGHLW